MRVVQPRRQASEARPHIDASGSLPHFLRLVGAFILALVMVMGTSSMAAEADEHVDLTPGPTVIADPESPTGYIVHFVYHNPDATSVTFVADILLRNWEDRSDTTIYQPGEYEPGLMRGGGA